MRWILGITTALTLSFCVPTPEQAEAQAAAETPLEEAMATVRESVEAHDTTRFIHLLDITVPMIMSEPRLDADGKVMLIGGLLVLAHRLESPDARIAAEGWLLASIETLYGPDHEHAEASRARLSMLLLEAGRTEEAARLHSGASRGSDERMLANAIRAQQLMQAGAFEEAVRILEAELQEDLRRRGPEHPERFPLLHLLGQAYLGAGLPDRAVKVLEPAFRWSREGHYADPEIYALSGLLYGQALTQVGDVETAKRVLDEAHSAAEAALGPEHRTSLMLGIVRANAYAASGSIRSYTEQMNRNLGLSRNSALAPVERATALQQRAHELMAFGRYTEAEPILRELIALSDQTPDLDPLIGIQAREMLGNLLISTDLFGGGRSLLEEAAHSYEALLGPDDILTLRAKAKLVRLPDISMSLSAEDLERAKYLLRSPKTEVMDPERLSENRALLKRYNAALRELQQKTWTPSPEDIEILRRLAAAEMSIVPDPMLQFAPGISIDAVTARYILAEALISAGKAHEALREIDAVLARVPPDLPPDSQALAGLLWDLRAEALRGMNQLAEAVATFDQAVAGALDARRWLNSMPTSGSSERPDVFGYAGWDYANAAWALAQTPGQNADKLRARAFETVQIMEFGDAAQALSRSETRRMRQDPGAAAAIKQWDIALAAVEGLTARSFGDPSALPANTALDAAEARLRQSVPDFFTYLVPDPVRWSELRGEGGREALLSDDEALVLIVPASPSSDDLQPGTGFVFAASRTELAWARIPLSTIELAEAAARLRNDLDDRGAQWTGIMSRAPLDPGASVGGERDPVLFDAASAHALYRTLFGNPEIAKVLEGKDQWILVPQGSMMTLPLASLVTKAPPEQPTNGRALRELHWLGLERALTILPSTTALRARRPPPQPTVLSGPDERRLAYLGFGDPAFAGVPGTMRTSADDLFAERENRARAVARLPRLPGTRVEVSHLANLFAPGGSARFLGPDASEATFAQLSTQGHLSEIGILHFATHGLLAGDFRHLSEPALALSPPADGAVVERPGGLDDGLLTASEISGMRLSVDWVILSACDTSGAADLRSSLDGLSGLVRAFLVAGARSLMVSHWRVEDDIAVALTTSTVLGTLNGQGKAEALRQAMREIANDTARDDTDLPLSHPTVWAPFFLVGAD